MRRRVELWVLAAARPWYEVLADMHFSERASVFLLLASSVF
jgi:hypothetical protein